MTRFKELVQGEDLRRRCLGSTPYPVSKVRESEERSNVDSSSVSANEGFKMVTKPEIAKKSRWENVRNFVQEEDGMEAIQVVMIVAIAALVLVVLMTFWDKIKGWADTAIGIITGRTQG